MDIRRTDSETDVVFDDALSIRRTVFIDEQGVPADRELDGLDETAVHFVAYTGDDPVGAARLRTYQDDEPAESIDESTGKIERVSVLSEHRGNGIGRRLMREIENAASGLGYDELVMYAQTPVVGFYRELGYRTEGEIFEDAGIPHRSMRKRL